MGHSNINIIVGLMVLVLGRKMFWLFVGTVGFLVGMELTGVLLADRPQWVLLSVGLGAGLLGALLAVFAKRVALALGGFGAGSYLALTLGESFGAGAHSMVLFVVGGVIGAVCVTVIVDWTIILLSCLVGSATIVQGLNLGDPLRSLAFVALVVAGVFLQARLMTRSGTARRVTGLPG